MKNILLFGDSNTWGLIPATRDRFSPEIRWPGILQNKLKSHGISIIEEGLCGRTAAFDNNGCSDKNGSKSLPLIIEKNSPIYAAVIMLGTNDCKTVYNASAREIGKGIELCLKIISGAVPLNRILLVSPILLENDVWKPEKDPEFSIQSVLICKGLKSEYKKIAERLGVGFLAAEDYAKASEKDCEHLSADGHAALAHAVFQKLSDMNIG